MIPGAPSRTAISAATHRAAHQLLDGGCIFADRLALRILNAEPAEILASASAEPARGAIRLFIACRHRVAEDAVARAVADGVRQVVVLGAGLDTSAYRSVHGDDVIWFEVDYPATQAWKQRRLREAGIAVPGWLRFASIDFETETLGARLAAAGFDALAPSIFIWLGVVPYLTEAAIFATLEYIGGLPGGSEVVFDYADPPANWPAELRPMLDARAARVAAMGEAWISFFEPAPLAERLRGLGFVEIRDFLSGPIIAEYLPEFAVTERARGGHILWARSG
ncbi:MAG: SAM-dependent methyltransferase [Rhodospirillales bacterium]